MVCNGFVYNGRGNQHVNDNLTIFIENDRCTVLLSNRQQNVVMQFNPPTPRGKFSGQSASTYRQIIIEIVILTAVFIHKTITRHPQSPPEC